VLALPLAELLQVATARQILERHAPELVHTELVAVGGTPSLVDLARTARISARVLRAVGEELAVSAER
jgi:hypothetical protein